LKRPCLAEFRESRPFAFLVTKPDEPWRALMGSLLGALFLARSKSSSVTDRLAKSSPRSCERVLVPRLHWESAQDVPGFARYGSRA
jgi:hypothetical protein